MKDFKKDSDGMPRHIHHCDDCEPRPIPMLDLEVKKCPLCGQRTEKGFVLDWELIHKMSKCPQIKAEGK